MNEMVTVTLTAGFIMQMQEWVSGLVTNAQNAATVNGGWPGITVAHDDLLAVLQLPPNDLPND